MRVFLTSPWIPAEWVRAHGLEPRGIWFAEKFRPDPPPLAAGVCARVQRARPSGAHDRTRLIPRVRAIAIAAALSARRFGTRERAAAAVADAQP